MKVSPENSDALPPLTEIVFHTTGGLSEKYNFEPEFEQQIHYMQSVHWYKHHQNNQIVAGSFVDGVLVARSVITLLAAPLGIGFIYRIERGPVAIDLNSLRLHIEQLLHEFHRKRILIEICPYEENPDHIRELREYLDSSKWKHVDWTRTFYKNSVVVDLASDLDDIKKGFRKALKRSINKAIKAGLWCKIISDALTIEKLISLYNLTAAKKNFKPLSDFDQAFIVEGVAKGTISVCAIFIEDECVGGNFMVTMGDKVLVEWRVFSDNPTHRRFPLAHLADWESIQWAKKNGYKSYDFAGYWLDKGDENSINRYKTGFSKTILPLMPEYDYYENAKTLYFIIYSVRYAKKIRFQLSNFKVRSQLKSWTLSTQSRGVIKRVFRWI